MTERLYYTDANLLSFDARIAEVGREGDRFYTILDRSAFYPTSGGQLYDTGRLGHAEVIEVIEDESGYVRHLTADAVGTVGEMIRGTIDAERRRRHRQQHTAQHILSQAFAELFGLATVSVHLGEEYGAVELETVNIASEQIRQVGERAMEIVFANFPVRVQFVEHAEALEMPLRKIPKREGTIRVVRIGEYDYSACGGTHCDSTAQVGLIHIIGVDKMRGHALVNFLAGEQTRADYVARFEVTTALANAFTCHVSDLPERTARLAEENKSLKRELSRLQKEMLPSQAETIAAQKMRAGKHDLVFVDLGEYDPKLAAQLAAMVADRTSGPTALLCDGKLVLAVPPDSGLHAGNLMRELSAETGLRGGGGPAMAQAGGAERSRLAEYRETLERLLNEG